VSANQTYFVAIASGAILWLATSAISGRQEAWDSTLYWTVAYPMAIIVAGTLGYLSPERAWRWALALMLAQAVTLIIAASSFGLLPLGLIMFAALALPPVAMATCAAAIRKQRNR